MATRPMTLARFSQALEEGLLSLPEDCKEVLRLIDDPDLDDASRVLACGALLHVLAGTNAIPGARGILAYADDVIVLRLMLERVEQRSADVVRAHAASEPELYAAMRVELAAIREHLGEDLAVLDRAVDQLPKLQHEGRDAASLARDDDGITWLYDAVQEAIVARLELPSADVARAVKDAGRLASLLKQRL